jgi:hypothetical protein
MKMHSLLALLILIPQAHATSFFIRPFSEFTKTTNVIVRGVTTGIHAEKVSNQIGEQMIYTYANLGIREVIKGSITGASIRIRRAGGTLDGVTLDIPSSVEFKEGEEGVFFLGDEQDDRSFEVTGMELGKFRIEAQNGNEILKGGIFAYSKPKSGNHDSHAGHGHQADDISENLKPWSIQQLKDLIQSQGDTPPENPPVGSSQPSPELPAVTSSTNSEQKKSDTTAPTPSINENSDALQQEPLYITPTFWYVLALSILTLSVYLVKRRG